MSIRIQKKKINLKIHNNIVLFVDQNLHFQGLDNGPLQEYKTKIKDYIGKKKLIIKYLVSILPVVLK
jgi:hypothetical protein